MTPKYIRLSNILKEQISSNIRKGIYVLPTEEKLCKKYGVSRQTVRHALEILIDEDLIERRQGSGTYIKDTSPNSAKGQVAVLLTHDNEYIYPSMLGDILFALNRENYSSTLYLTENKTAKEREFLKHLLNHPVHGIIAEPVRSALPNPNLDLYDLLRERGTVILFLSGLYPNFPAFPYVKSDDFYGGYILGKYLLQRRHHVITGIFRQDDHKGIQRYLGLITALTDASAAFKDENIGWFSSDELTRLQEKQDTGFLAEFIRSRLNTCTAVVCHNDEIAYWLMKELKTAGISVPADVSIVSFDNSYLSNFGAQRITSLSHKTHELGRTAAAGLVSLLQGKPFTSVSLSWHLVTRSSDKIHEN
ncbi:MAG TPA: GntR family transcriptional regulator [Lachnospiraceae bacterium]|nr:GntR family transcriptional regulator [Lachnospiraceae bacterium]